MYWDVVEVKPIAPMTPEVRFADGLVTWPGKLDLAPDAVYYAIKRLGEWRLA